MTMADSKDPFAELAAKIKKDTEAFSKEVAKMVDEIKKARKALEEAITKKI